MSIAEFKVGTSFEPSAVYTPVTGLAPASLANTTVTSQIRRQTGELVCALAVTKAVDNLSFTMRANAGTANWPYGITALWDIKFVDTVFGTFYSETAQLKLVRPETR